MARGWHRDKTGHRAAAKKGWLKRRGAKRWTPSRNEVDFDKLIGELDDTLDELKLARVQQKAAELEVPSYGREIVHTFEYDPNLDEFVSEEHVEKIRLRDKTGQERTFYWIRPEEQIRAKKRLLTR